MGFFDALKDIFSLDSFYAEPENGGSRSEIAQAIHDAPWPDLNKMDQGATTPAVGGEPRTGVISLADQQTTPLPDFHPDVDRDTEILPAVMKPTPEGSADTTPLPAAWGRGAGDLPTLPGTEVGTPTVNVDGERLPSLAHAPVTPEIGEGMTSGRLEHARAMVPNATRGVVQAAGAYGRSRS